MPLSHAGAWSHALQLAELVPAQCAAVGVTNLVVASGPSTSGTTQNDLILGQSGSGSFHYTGATGDDCIVAGGGAGTNNHISGGGGTDVCVGAPGAHNIFTGCARTYN